MTLELQVLTGSRAGANLRFEKSEVTVGRHAASDLRFDPQADLDVSTRHAELHELNGTWTIVDEASTNGTYVNGVRVSGSKTIRDGDVISFGVSGPRVEVRSGAGVRLDASGEPVASFTALSTPKYATRISPARLDTGVRVAMAVQEQTSAMKRTFTVALVALVVLAAAGFFWTQRQSRAREAEYLALIARGDSATTALQKTIASIGDPATTAALTAELERKKQELASARVMMQQGGTTRSNIESLSKSMSPMLNVGQMDVPKIRDANDAAIAFIVADLDGTNMGGTGFSISAGGLVVTNKHVVTSQSGQPPKRLAVKFANMKEWKHAHLVRVSDSDDLALLQIDDAGKVPVVAGVSRGGSRAKVGSPVVTVGFPLSNDTPMDGGEGMNFVARTTTTLGTVSKLLDDVLQLDSFSAHGASGSPVFDAEGNVVGVIYGGASESGGRIVYAVPAQRLVNFLAADGVPVLR